MTSEIYLKSSKQIEDSVWDGLVNSSLESSPFLHSSFLRSVELDESRIILMEKNKPIVGCCLVSYDQAVLKDKFAYSAYQGIFFPELARDNYSGENEALRRLSLFIELIDGQGEPRHFSLHPRINDLRPINWHYFQNKVSTLEASISTRYTGLISMQDFESFDDYLTSIQKVRYREYRNSFQHPLSIDSNSVDISSFMKMYNATFNRQQIEVPISLQNRCVAIMTDALELGSGKLRILYTDRGDPVAGVFILSNKTTDVYLFGASDQNFHKINGPTRLLLDSIKESFAAGRTNFDFCGMNSPNRGYFKSTFNARVTPYFEVDLLKK